MVLTRNQLPKFEFSQSGYDKLLAEKKKLDSDRVLVVEDLVKAREMGDLSENGYYKAARAKLSSIDSRIRRVNLMIKYGVVVSKNQNSEVVGFGSKVRVKVNNQRLEYEIVGPEEADPNKGKISLQSPIGQALEGKKVGEKVEVKGPTSSKTSLGVNMVWEVMEIK